MKITLIFLLFVFLYSCTGNQQSENSNVVSHHRVMAELKCLEGKWRMQSMQDTIFEEWTFVNDSLLNGRSFFIKGTDTIISETIRIIAKSGCVFYVPVVEHNNGTAVEFKLISDSSDVFVFENKEHDFPQQIIYIFNSLDSLTAKVQGLVNGKNVQEIFVMKRQKI